MSTDRKLTFIPGPIEFSNAVLEAMSIPSMAHTSPEFVAIFQQVIKKTRSLFNTSSTSQPFIIAGSGTLGWDIAGSNFINRDDKILVLSTGFFSDSFANALKVYSDNVDILSAPEFGSDVPLSLIENALKSKIYNAITITQTDTSSGVLSDVESIAKLVHSISPETLIFVDAVCATGCEKLQFDDWGIDYILTASQKAIGVPSGLSISLASKRAMEKALSKQPPTSFYTDLKRWTPIMKAYESGSGAYFATPPVQLINALNVSLDELLETGNINDRIYKHEIASNEFKEKIKSIGLKLVPLNNSIAAHGLSVIYYPNNVSPQDFLSKISSKGFTIASGIYKDYKDKYFRVGHMGVTAVGERKDELDQLFQVIKSTVEELS